MNIWRKAVAGIGLGIGLSIAWIVGGNLVRDVRFAHAQEQVEATRQQIANVQDLASVFKAVNKAVEQSVVNISVRKTVRNPISRFHDEDLLRRFFGRDRDGDGEPEAPEGGFQFDVPGMPEQFEQEGTGSGVIIEVDGDAAYIVTNNHVAGSASEMTVTLADGREITNAKLIGADPKSDLAVIRIEADRVIPAKWGDSDTLEKGDIILAFGSPFGFVGSMTQGIVSAINRQARIISGPFAYENFIQVDAPINPGNSGGPLVNLRGEVVGINTAIATRSGGFQGLGFAIPSNQARYVYEAIKSKGRVVRGWLGIEIMDISKATDEAAALGYSQREGVLVRGLVNNTPAAGKLEPSDIIVELNGEKIENVQQLRNQIATMEPGKEVKMQVFRNRKMQEVTVKLGEQPDDYTQVAGMQSNDRGGGAAQSTAESLGVRVGQVNADVINRYGLPEGVTGAVVTAVRPGSAAELNGLRPGDVITKVDNTTIESPDDLVSALSDKDLSKGVRIFWTNRSGARFGFFKVENAR